MVARATAKAKCDVTAHHYYDRSLVVVTERQVALGDDGTILHTPMLMMRTVLRKDFEYGHSNSARYVGPRNPFVDWE
jgi:hypothetical protein